MYKRQALGSRPAEEEKEEDKGDAGEDVPDTGNPRKSGISPAGEGEGQHLDGAADSHHHSGEGDVYKRQVYTNTSYPDQDAFLASCRQNQYDFWLIYDRGTTTAYYRLEGSGEGQPPQQVEYTGYYGESYPFYFNPSTDGDGMVLLSLIHI